MLILSSVLGEIIKEYQEYALARGRQSRIVVPGLTPTIAREIHSYLLEQGIVGYLVIGSDLQPDEDKSWIRPAGLTSKRIGSFVAVACPGQLAQIQDSIRGSGGTIRSVAFSEEWPWIDSGSESFRFDGPVLRRLVSRWADTEENREWLYHFVMELVVPSARSCSERAILILERLVGSFAPTLYPELHDVRLKILFHSGLPRPHGDVPPVNLLRSIPRLCERIVERCRREDGTRQQTLDMVPKVIPLEDQPDVSEALNALLDGIGQSRTLDFGALAFFSCWSKNIEHWSVLDTMRLERLFEVQPPERVELKYVVRCGRSLISSNGSLVATFHGEAISFSGIYSLPQDHFEQYPWTARLTHRGRVLQSEDLDSAKGEFTFQVDTSISFTRYKSGLLLRLGLFAGQEVRGEARIRLHLCGAERPAFAVVEPGFEVVDADVRSEDEPPVRRVESNEPSHVYMLSHTEEPKLLDLDEDELLIIETGHRGIWRSASRADPLEDSSGRVVRICQFGSIASIICFEAKDVERGEFTIEDELRVQTAGQRERHIEELIAIFRGARQEPYRWLGKLNDPSRRRMLLASDATSERGWRPLVADLLGGDFRGAGALGDFVSFRGAVQAPGFRNLLLPGRVLELLREYASVRHELIELVRSNVDRTSYSLEHPEYALNPIYVDNRASEMSALLVRYLHAYTRILDYVDHARNELEWSQLFVLTYLDCVVHWDSSSLRNGFCLVGPWHPLVVSKRYMVQACLYHRAENLNSSNGKVFRRLVALLRETSGFRWLLGLHRNDRLLEPLYVMPTSDPGWHLAIKQDLGTVAAQSPAGSLAGLLAGLRERLGFDSAILQGHAEDLARSGLTSFVRAFPGRRSVGIRVREGYSTGELVSLIESLLHEDEKPTELGEQLPGGVHLFVEDAIPDPEGMNWSDPPILVYRHEDDQGCFREANPDMYMLASPRDLFFRPADEWHGLPRGAGMQSVFSEPVCWLTEGQAHLPNSVTLEVDSQPAETCDLGQTFVGTTSRACGIPRSRVVMVHCAELPHHLDCPWVIVPGGGLDPAIFVKYVRDGSARAIQDRALWDYRLDITGSKNTYYVLSTVPKGFAVATNGFFGREDVAAGFIQNLGEIGIAIGGEALKAGRHALGVVGLVGTIRLLRGIGGSGKGAFHESEDKIGFLIPVDSFVSFFGGRVKVDYEPNGSKRTDLLAIQLVLPKGGDSPLYILACGVESKFVSDRLGQSRAVEALRQAQVSLDQFRQLVQISRERWAMPERLGLLALIKFGLRMTSPSEQERIRTRIEPERRVITAMLRGNYEYRQAKYSAVLVSTEGRLPGVAEANPLAEGLWVRVNREHWPGISDTPQLEAIRDELAGLFGVPEHGQPGARDGVLTLESEERRAVPAETSQPAELVVGGQPEELQVSSPGGDEPSFDGGSATTEKPGTSDEPPEGTSLRRILLGVDDARRPLYFDPQSPVDPLDNLNIMVCGSSGTGKTQLLKYLICRIREQAKNTLVVDFKNDFANDPSFSDRASLERVFVTFDGLPFNPLIPYPIRHPGTGRLLVQIGQHISGVASVLSRTYGLGAQQQVSVRRAITESFGAEGLPTAGTVSFDGSMRFPDFNGVGARLRESNPGAYNRLDPLFALDLFRSEYRQDSFHALVNRSMILDLSQIPNDEIKNTLAELLVLSSHAYYNAQPHSGAIRQFLVLDEAHRVLASDFMSRLVRECRAYGVGSILSSQYPSDFPAEISSSMATKILHSNGRDVDRVRAIAQIMGCTGREADIANLDRFQAFIDNRHTPHTLVRTMNYPLHLIWSHLLQDSKATREVLERIEGVDPDKLPIGNLVRQLERLGLVQEKEGRVQLLQHHE